MKLCSLLLVILLLVPLVSAGGLERPEISFFSNTGLITVFPLPKGNVEKVFFMPDPEEMLLIGVINRKIPVIGTLDVTYTKGVKQRFSVGGDGRFLTIYAHSETDSKEGIAAVNRRFSYPLYSVESLGGVLDKPNFAEVILAQLSFSVDGDCLRSVESSSPTQVITQEQGGCISAFTIFSPYSLENREFVVVTASPESVVLSCEGSLHIVHNVQSIKEKDHYLEMANKVFRLSEVGGQMLLSPVNGEGEKLLLKGATHPPENLVGDATTSSSGPPCCDGVCIVKKAKSFIGYPYVWGGDSPEEGGLDCSGTAYRTYRRSVSAFNTRLTANDYYGIARKEASLICGGVEESCQSATNLLRQGDVLFIQKRNDPSRASHIAIYAGNDHVIDASRKNKEASEPGVTERPLPSYWFRNRWVKSYRFSFVSSCPADTSSEQKDEKEKKEGEDVKVKQESLLCGLKLSKDTFLTDEATDYRFPIIKVEWNRRQGEMTYQYVTIDTSELEAKPLTRARVTIICPERVQVSEKGKGDDGDRAFHETDEGVYSWKPSRIEQPVIGSEYSHFEDREELFTRLSNDEPLPLMETGKEDLPYEIPSESVAFEREGDYLLLHEPSELADDWGVSEEWLAGKRWTLQQQGDNLYAIPLHNEESMGELQTGLSQNS